jgi:hypothetical protein
MSAATKETLRAEGSAVLLKRYHGTFLDPAQRKPHTTTAEGRITCTLERLLSNRGASPLVALIWHIHKKTS